MTMMSETHARIEDVRDRRASRRTRAIHDAATALSKRGSKPSTDEIMKLADYILSEVGDV